jgi:DNA-binding PadR family transcriptional regulator
LLDPTAFLPLHALEMHVLLILIEGSSHAYGIVSEIERREPDLRVYPANLYRRLRDMAESGLLEETPVPGVDDARRRRYFQVTPLGHAVAREEAERLGRILATARQAGLTEAAG